MTEVLLWVVGIAAAALGVALSIALHEVGHLVPAKAFGVKVTQYMVGFGPTVVSRRRGETEYGLKWVPLGGYVRMVGMFPPKPGEGLRSSATGRWALMVEEARRAGAAEVAPGDERRAFYRLPVPKRVVVMLGGPLVNLLLALLLTAVALSAVGSPGSSLTVASVPRCVLPTTVAATAGGCPADAAPSPAAAAGLLPGDVLRSVDGTPVADWDDFSARVRAATGRELRVGVQREGRELTLLATPVPNQRYAVDADGNPTERVETVGYLGISPQLALEREPVTAVPGLVADQVAGAAGIVLRLPQRLYDVAQAAFGSAPRDPAGPIGVVGVGRLAGELNAADALVPGQELAERAGRLLTLLAGLNVALFVFNLVPLLPFDGGHVVGALWEAVKRGWARLRHRPDPGPVDVAKAVPLAYGVSVLLIGMSALLLYADIVRPVTLGQ